MIARSRCRASAQHILQVGFGERFDFEREPLMNGVARQDRRKAALIEHGDRRSAPVTRSGAAPPAHQRPERSPHSHARRGRRDGASAAQGWRGPPPRHAGHRAKRRRRRACGRIWPCTPSQSLPKRRRTARAGFGPAAYRQARIDKVKPTSYHPRSAAPGGTRSGGVAERLKAADCKSADVCLRRFESYPLHQRLRRGSRQDRRLGARSRKGHSSGCSSMVEFQPSKLATWVRFPPPAPGRPF